MLSKNTFIRGGVWGGAVLAASVASAASAAQITLEVEIPQQNVAEYHKPYVAGWIEDASGAHVGNLFVRYDVKKRENAGQKWLKDLRTWWRKSGRDLTLPVDGLTGATWAPGRQTLSLDSAVALKDLKAGTYSVVVEASREAGGHDLVKVPFAYAPARAVTSAAKGDGELGEVKVLYKP
jgi:hypothetical protein